MKIVSFLLVLAMLLSFAACGTPAEPVETGETTDETTPEETTTADPMDIQTGTDYYVAADYLPAETFDGEDVHVWMDGLYTVLYVPEENLIEGDIVQEAVIERNAAVEEGLDVVLNWNYDRKGYRNQAEFRQSILAGDEYDIIEGPTGNLSQNVVYGCYMDMAKSEYIDFSQPWWIEEATSTLAIYDKQYLASGYFDFSSIERMGVFFFSDPLVLDYRLGNLYDLVESGEWTWDKMVELCEIVAEDVNQDGVMDGSDRYGLSGRWDWWASEPATCGYQYITLNDEGEYEITGVTDELLELSDKIYPVITSTNGFYFSRYTYRVHPRFPGAVDSEGKTMFTNNQILFMLESLGWTSSQVLRNYGAYGILPSPKYLEGQEDYGTATTSHSSTVCSTTGNAKISEIVLEAFQIESYNILRPAYTVDALSYKYLSDPQAVAMLQLIFRELSTDWSYNFAGAGLGGELWRSMPTEQYLGSYFQKNSAAVEQKLADFLQSVDSMP